MGARTEIFCRTGSLALLLALPDIVFAAPTSIQFENTTAPSGLDYVGRSWGSMWGDFNGDGAPDFWLVNHQSAPSLYLNEGDGSFLDIASQVILPEFLEIYDSHGAAWSDFDNDGDADIYQLADEGNGPIPNYFFVNEAGSLVEQATAVGLENVLGRGRMPLWLDYDRDGLLDVFHPVTRRGDGSDEPNALFRQALPGQFSNVATAVGLAANTKGANFAILSDLTGDGSPEMLTHLVSGFPDKVFEMSSTPFVDLRDQLGIPLTTYPVFDAVSVDFDGDLDNDLFLVRGEKAEDWVQVDSHTVEAHLEGSSTESGIEWQTNGSMTFDIYPRFTWDLDEIHIGATGIHPADHLFTLPPGDSATWGILSHSPGIDEGLYIGYSPGTMTWELLRSTRKVNAVLVSTTAISTVGEIGWDLSTPARDDQLLINLDSSFQEQASSRGIVTPCAARSIAAGDFDNDMDIDLYLVSTGPVANLPNLLYENQGGGNFSLVAGGGGAAGTSLGRGDAVTMADYDSDGFLDLLVTNGVSKSPFELDGPTELFRNLGNGNHWIELDLVGVTSNRDGIGCRLIGTAGGVKQLREQNAGIHYRGQNHGRIHFGLGPYTQLDTLDVLWPSGVTQQITGITADQIFTVTEPVVTSTDPSTVTNVSLEFLGCSPNPLLPGTVISFVVGQPGLVSLSAYGLSGRLVLRIIDGKHFTSGIHRVAWDGRDGSGNQIASGVYFIEMKMGTERRVRKVVRLK